MNVSSVKSHESDDDSNYEQEKLVKDTPKRPTPINVSIVSLHKGNLASAKGTNS
jgi:hypothetical protein